METVFWKHVNDDTDPADLYSTAEAEAHAAEVVAGPDAPTKDDGEPYDVDEYIDGYFEPHDMTPDQFADAVWLVTKVLQAANDDWNAGTGDDETDEFAGEFQDRWGPWLDGVHFARLDAALHDWHA